MTLQNVQNEKEKTKKQKKRMKNDILIIAIILNMIVFSSNSQFVLRDLVKELLNC